MNQKSFTQLLFGICMVGLAIGLFNSLGNYSKQKSQIRSSKETHKVSINTINNNSLINQTSRVVFTKNGDIWAINSDGTDSKQLTNYGANFKPQLSPSLDFVAYYSLDSQTKQNMLSQEGTYDDTNVNFWTIKTDGSSPVKLTESNISAHRNSLAWSPTEDMLAYIEDGKVIMIKQDGTMKKIVTDLRLTSKFITAYPNFLKLLWSPDGNELAVYGQTRVAEGAGDEGSPELIIYSKDGKILNTVDNVKISLYWSQNDTIYYSEDTNGIGTYALWKRDMKGSTPKLISGTADLSGMDKHKMEQEGIFGASEFEISRNEKKIVTVRNGDSPLWIMNIDGTNSHPIKLPSQISELLKKNQSESSKETAYLRQVKWLPDNDHLVFQIYIAGFGKAVGLSINKSSLFSIKEDGSDLKILDATHEIKNNVPYFIQDNEVSTGVETAH